MRLAAAQLAGLTKLGRAVGDPTRCRLVLALLAGPGYPAELAAELGLTRANVSNHLACLRECGLIVASAEGRRVRYQLADPGLAPALRVLADLLVGPPSPSRPVLAAPVPEAPAPRRTRPAATAPVPAGTAEAVR